MTGRPSLYTDNLANEICERLARGEPLARICSDEAMPNYSTVRRWEKENVEFQALSARAKSDGTHYLADDSLIIADEPLPNDPDEAKVAMMHRKLKIDTRFRLIGKWNSKEYGEKTLIGSDPDNPLPVGFDVALIAAPPKQITDATKEND